MTKFLRTKLSKNLEVSTKPIINGAVILGDSLSDEGKKYNEDVCCCLPFKWVLHPSPYGDFTDGHTWAYIVQNILNNIAEKNLIWLRGCEQESANQFTFFKNVAEGGATAYDYRNIASFFRYFKGFILSFFLGNTQKQARKLKVSRSVLHPNRLGIIFAGANDLVTLDYDDGQGVERAVQGIHKTMEILTERVEKTNFNYLKHILLIGLPDISETPRFAHKSSEKKAAIKSACQEYNRRLQAFANAYQYVNFDLCTIYKFTDINNLQRSVIKEIKNGIVVTGEGKSRKALFINNGEFISDKYNKALTIDISLFKKQLKIFSKEDGQVRIDSKNRNELNALVDKVAKKAKLNVDIKMLDVGVIFDNVYQNPVAYEFTSGCAVYYLRQDNQESDETVISKKVITGNAVIINQIGNDFFSYLVKDGKLIEKQTKIVKQEFKLSIETQSELKEKLEQHLPEEKIISLAGMEDKHDICIIKIIQSVVECFKKSFKEKIVLTSIDDSVLESIKKGYSNRNDISWDDLHPAREVHRILASEIYRFIDNNYLLNGALRFRDDSVIGVKSKPSDRFNEAPVSLPSEPSLMKTDSVESNRVESKVACRA